MAICSLSLISIHIATSALGVLFGFSAFVVFFCVYHNIDAGTWGLLSGIFAILCLQLHLIRYSNKLEEYHSVRTLTQLSHLGITAGIISTGCFFWYIFELLYWHIPMMPIGSSAVISSVWVFMTLKWGYLLHYFCNVYKRTLARSYAPLIA